MKILITGGTGFIGQTLCPALLAAGHTLTVYSRYPEKVNATLGDQVTSFDFLKTLSESDHFDVIINIQSHYRAYVFLKYLLTRLFQGRLLTQHKNLYLF